MRGSIFLTVMGIVYLMMASIASVIQLVPLWIGIPIAAAFLLSQWSFLYAGSWSTRQEGVADRNPAIPIILGTFSFLVTMVWLFACFFSDDYEISAGFLAMAIPAALLMSAGTVGLDQWAFRRRPSLARRSWALGIMAGHTLLATILSAVALLALEQITMPGWGTGIWFLAAFVWILVLGIFALWLVPPAIVLLSWRMQRRN